MGASYVAPIHKLCLGYVRVIQISDEMCGCPTDQQEWAAQKDVKLTVATDDVESDL